jgi:hypothetical protein
LDQDADFQLAHQRGVQATIWGMPAVSLASLRDATFRDLGARYNDVVYMSGLPLPRHELLTPSDEAPFIVVMLDLREGPVVLEVPAATQSLSLLGCAVDAWMVPIADVGAAGEDGGRGGRYLFLPPELDGRVPPGYLPCSSKTFEVFVSLRPIAKPTVPAADVVDYSKRVRAYPYALRDEPPAGRYIDAFPKAWRTLPAYDMSFFERLARAIDREPSQEKDSAMLGMLTTIGIRKGSPFLPQGWLVRALERAIHDGRRQMEHYFETPGLGTTPYRPDGQWVIGNRTPHDGATFFVDGRLLLDERAGGYSYWTRFAPKRPRTGVFCLRALRDADGGLLEGRRLYRLSVPRDLPAREHWSLIAYDKESKALLRSDLDRIGVRSRDRARLRANSDGSMDVFFGPDAPHGKSSNWVATGSDFFLILWLYGPEKSVLGRSFRMPDPERLD